ncbi:MAG: lamin tail domain-containing protein, partial [Bacteroidetes bacterium]
DYIEYIAGNSPFILSAPHGGSLEPAEIPDRTFGTTTKDANTEETARDIQAAYHLRTGQYPHVIICRLHRRKLDANREVAEGAQGNEFAVQAWNEFQAFIDSAKAAAVRSHGAAFYIDLHGHGHAVQRLELGYLLTASELDLPDNALDAAAGYRNSSSIRTLAAAAEVPFAEVLRGESSFGGFMEYLGYPSVPGVMRPTPANDPYFTGGYNTDRHGSRNGGTVSGLQIESNYTGVRDTDANRKAYARAMADAVARFSRLHLFNEVTLLRPAVRINEVLFDVPDDDAGTPAPEGDANGDGVRSPRGDEFIEIMNTGGDTASIGGYRLADRGLATFFTFPEGTRLAPNGVAVVFGGMGPGGSGPNVPAGTLVFAARPGIADSGFAVSASKSELLSAGDGVVLLDPSVNYAADEVCWGSAAVRTKNGRKLVAPNTASGDSIAGAIRQSVTRTVPGTGAWTSHRSVSSSPY